LLALEETSALQPSPLHLPFFILQYIVFFRSFSSCSPDPTFDHCAPCIERHAAIALLLHRFFHAPAP
jgi:hypothetical protein